MSRKKYKHGFDGVMAVKPWYEKRFYLGGARDPITGIYTHDLRIRLVKQFRQKESQPTTIKSFKKWVAEEFSARYVMDIQRNEWALEFPTVEAKEQFVTYVILFAVASNSHKNYGV